MRKKEKCVEEGEREKKKEGASGGGGGRPPRCPRITRGMRNRAFSWGVSLVRSG